MPKLQDWLFLVLLAFIWGSSFIIMKKALLVFSPEQVAALRIFIATLSVVPLIPYSWKRFKKKDYKIIALIAILGSGIPPFFFTLAQTQISSALTGLLNTLTPLFTFLIGLLFFGILFQTRKLLGVLMGMAGGLFLIFFSEPSGDSSNNLFALFVLAAAFCYATNSNLIKNYAQNIPPIILNTIGFLFIGPPAGIFVFSTDFLDRMELPNAWSTLGLVAILAIIGTAIANMLYFKLTQRTSALFASTVTYLIPVIAIFWGFLDGENIDWTYPVGLSFILFGVYLTSRK